MLIVKLHTFTAAIVVLVSEISILNRWKILALNFQPSIADSKAITGQRLIMWLMAHNFLDLFWPTLTDYAAIYSHIGSDQASGGLV